MKTSHFVFINLWTTTPLLHIVSEVRAASLILCLGILLATIQNGIAERRIVCYYSNWSVYRPGTAKFSPQNINPYLCTHLIYAFGGFTKENTLKPFDKYQDIEKGGYAKFTGLKTYNKNLKTILAIGGWNEGSSRFSPMVADPARRREFVKNAVKFLRQNHFDGLDLDWEYPAFRDGGKPRDKDNYANLVQELREEFERESSKTGRPRLLLSMAVPAGIEYIDKGYDIPRLNEYLDFINLLSYDYHSAYEPAVNHHSPLYPLEEDNEYNYDAELTIDHTISHLLEKGASADKVVLGIPTYGRSYTLFNEDATDIGSPADGPGAEGEATREKGYLSYYEICEGIAESDDWEVVQPNPKAMGPYAFKGNQWVGYDDVHIVKLKANYVNEKKLGGIMFWSIDNDDFRGKCHGRPYPLIEAAKEALLADNGNTIDKTKSTDTRKKTRTRAQSTQSNNAARKSSTSNRRSSTTSAPITKRVPSSRPKFRSSVLRTKTNNENQEDREVSRRSYDPSTDDDTEGKNTVRITEKSERPKNRNRSKSSADRNSSRKQSRRKGQSKTGENEESLSNKLTTPEPPTTPDPGSDFKCEDEGFFPHPRDCKKYFWCLDSGPSGLGVVAHQFTCPSGLVFNKAADSCDYPRNVICPKTKTSIVSTTRSPITAATSRTTYLHSTTTEKAESAESEEEYDSEEDYEDEVEEDEEEEEVKEEPTTTTTAKPLVYKTLTRSRPSTTTTTTTTTAKPSEPERISDSEEDEEDPRVIKELIDLIKKAGGIEQLEKQLLLQEKNSDATSGSENVTPATISRSLYERVLNRQANRFGSQRPILSSSETSYVNGPGRAQFEGLDDIPEVKSLRRSQKPQYVTIERPKSATKENEEEIDEEEEEEDDNIDVATIEEENISPLEDGLSTQRVTPSYVNIRRARPSTTTSKIENDVEEKEVEIEEERPTRRRRPFVSSKQEKNDASSETSKYFRNRGSSFRNSEKEDGSKGANGSAEKDDDSTTKSRYISIQRFRSTTSKISEDSSGATPTSAELISETTIPSRPEVFITTPRTIILSSTTPTTPTTSTSTEVITVISVEPSENPSSVSPGTSATRSATDSTRLVEDAATETPLTTLPIASSSSHSTLPTTTTTTTTTTTLASRSTIAAVSQPRPFGFTRRRSGLSDATTATTTPLSRSKVADSKAVRLPTLRELIGYPTTRHDDRIAATPSSALLHLPRDDDVDNDIGQQSKRESFGETRESRDVAERVLAQPSRNIVAEIGEAWLARPASEGKSLASKSSDSILDERSSSAIDPAPTTMRGIPLATLTSKPSEMRGFYITRSDVPAVDDTTPFYSTTERQTEIGAVSAESDRHESEFNSFNASRSNDIISEKESAREERLSPFSYSTISSNYEETIPVGGPSLKRAKSRGFEHSATPLPYAVSSTSSRRRKIAARYTVATTPLWTGKRVVSRRRNRLSGSTRVTLDAVASASTIPPAVTSVRRKFSATIPSAASESAMSPEIFDIVNYAESRATPTPALTVSSIATTASMTKIASNDPTTVVSDDLTTIRAGITNAPMIADLASTAAVAETPAVAAESALATTRRIETISVIADSEVTPVIADTTAIGNHSVITANIEVETARSANANYLTDFTNAPAIADADVETIDSVVASPPTNVGIETANYLTDITDEPATANAEAETIAMTSSSDTGFPTIANANATVADFAITVPANTQATETATTSAEITSTTPNYSTFAIPETASTRETIIPVTLPLTTVIMDRNDVTDADMTGTVPTIVDFIAVTTSADSNIFSASASSIASTSLALEHSTIQNTFHVDNSSEISTVTTIEVSPTFGSTSEVSKSPPTTNSGTPSSTETTAFLIRMDENTVTPTIIRTPSNVTPIADPAALEESAVLSTPSAISPKSIATSGIIQATAKTHEPDAALAISENSIKPETKVTSEEVASKDAQGQKQGRTSAQYNTTDYRFGQKRRRVVNRTKNWLGAPAIRETSNQYPRKPPSYASRATEHSHRRRVTQKRGRVNSEPIGSTGKSDEHNRVEEEMKSLKEVKGGLEEKETTTIIAREATRSPQFAAPVHYETLQAHENENIGKRRRVALKGIKSQSQGSIVTERNSINSDSITPADSLPDNSHIRNFHTNGSFSGREKTRRRMRVALKSVTPKFEEINSTNEAGADFNKNLQDDFHANETLSDRGNTRRKMRVVLKSVRPKSEEKSSTIEEASADSAFTGLQDNSTASASSSPVEEKPKRKMRVVLKSVKPKSEEVSMTTESATANPNSIGEDLQGGSSSDLRIDENLSDEEKARRQTEVVSKKPEERDSIVEETNAEFGIAKEYPPVIFTSNFSNEPHVGDGENTRSKSEEERKATIEQPEDTETSVQAEKDTDRPLFEVNFSNNGGSINRKLDSGYFNRRRKLTQSTTTAPLTTLPNTVNTIHRRVRPIDTTSRIDFVDAFENTDSYVKFTQNDQKTDVSDQSIRAQEFAVTLADPSDTGETTLRDALRRKISTTMTPRIDPATSITITSYSEDFRSRQKPRTKARPTVNATTRPRKPPVIDYDYYEDEIPLVVGKSVLNTKLFLTSKGTIRCLDQGNFPHPYSCKKFITCARMVNGQVIGTEYTCPNRLSFDPIGGICNWSAGLGCKD